MICDECMVTPYKIVNNALLICYVALMLPVILSV